MIPRGRAQGHAFRKAGIHFSGSCSRAVLSVSDPCNHRCVWHSASLIHPGAFQGQRSRKDATMQVSRYLFGFMVLVGALQIAPAQSQDAKAGDIVILQPWLRAAPRGAESTGGYLTIENKGT